MSTPADKLHTQPEIDETTAGAAVAPGEPSPESPADMPVRDPQDLDPGTPETIKPEDVDHDFDAPGKSRDDIYKHAQDLRTKEVGPDIDALDPAQQAQIRAAEAIAQGRDPEELETEQRDALATAMEAEAAGEPAPVETVGLVAAPVLDTAGEKTTLIVYGQPVEVTPHQIEEAGGSEALQKQLGAAMKFSRLATYEAQLRELDRNLTNREQMLSTAPPRQVTEQPQPPQGAEAEMTDEELDALTKEFSDGIFSGTEEEAQVKVRSVLSKVVRGRGPAATPTTEQLVGETVAELQRSGFIRAPDNPAETARLEANTMYRADYPELQQDIDPVAFRTVQAEIAEVTRSPVMTGRPLVEVVRMAAERVKKRFAGTSVESLDFTMDKSEIEAAEQPDLQTTGVRGRLILKERTVLPPSQAGVRNQPPPAAPPGQSNKAYINQLRKNSGQAAN